MGMGPGRAPKDCNNEELVGEFENACRGGDYEFADEYKAEIIKRLGASSPPAPTLQPGDKVRHKKNSAYGTGVVTQISKSGKRLYVDFAEIPDWDRKKLYWEPRGYFAPDALELVEEAPQ